MQIFLKAMNVQNPGVHGGKYWLDKHGKARYDEKPKDTIHKYIAKVTLPDGTEKYIYAKDDELDENDQVIGGQPQIREIINRELFGEYGFKTNGTFWQKKGILVEYKTRVTGKGKIEVDPIDRHEGYTSFEFRDSSVARAYGGSEEGLPKKITKYKIDAKPHEAPPAKDKIELEAGTTADQPPIEELGIHTTPKRLPQTLVAVGEKLTDKEDPLALASAYLAATFAVRKPSQAKTEAGQTKARADREGQFDGIEGFRKVQRLPIWAIAKFDSPAHLQAELSRGEGGRPLTTLITLGVWNPDNKSKRFREQLLSEWTPFIRRWARRNASVYASTDSYRKFDKIEGGTKAQRDWMYDRERDLFNEAVTVLLDQANKYLSNDEPKGPDSRFDLTVQNAIKNHLEKKAKIAAVEHHGATFLEDLSEEDSFHAPKMISPREQFELRHYEPQAVAILSELTSALKPEVRATFLSRLWIDDYHQHPDASEERVWNERRAARQDKHGESNLHWGRPWIRSGQSGTVTAISDQLADISIMMRGGKTQKLGELKPQHQMYYLEKWFNEAMDHVQGHLKTKNGGLTPEGAVVERWLRLEEKLARMNTKEIEGRIEHKTIKMPVKLDRYGREIKPVLVEHNRAYESPAVTFFKQPGSHRQLAERLNIADDLDLPLSAKNVNLPKPFVEKLKRVEGYHQRLQANLAHVGDLGPVHAEASKTAERHRNMGSWYRTPNNTTEWHEDNGVVALHEAAVKLHSSKGDNQQALVAYTSAANNLGADHPMVQDYTRRLATLGVEPPTNADLAQWKARSHSLYREHANRLHIVEFAQEQRNAKKSFVDLQDAFAKCLSAYDDLRKAFR